MFELLAARVSLWCWKINHWFILDWLMSCPNCNLVLNCAGSPRRFSSQELQDGKCHFNWDWPENPTTTLVSTDGVLLEVRNRNEGCRAWSPVATTSHVRTLSMLFFQDSTSTSTTLFIPSSGYTTWPCLVCLQHRSYTLLASCYRQAITLSHPLLPTILVSHLPKIMTPFIIFRTPPPPVIISR
jgi:hypothetical protein